MQRLGSVVDRHAVLLVVVLVVAVSIGWMVAGTHLLADDFVWLRNAHFDGAWQAGGERLVGRPGAWLLTAVTFGAMGAHPLVLFVVQGAIRVASAVLVFACLDEVLERRVAFAVSAVWIVTANHLALEAWFSAMPASLALALGAGGALVLLRWWKAGATGIGPLVWSCLLLAAAVATYELVAGAAALAVVAAPVLAGKRRRAGPIVAGLGAVAVPVLWNVTHSTVYGDAVTGPLDLRLVLPGHLSLGFAPFGVQGRIATFVGLATILVSIVRLARAESRPSTGVAERMAVAGGALIVAGAAPLLRFPTNFFGLHDRLTLVGGIGAALVWTAAALLVASLVDQPRTVLVGASVVLLVITVPLRIVRIRDYADAGRQAAAETARLAAEARTKHDLVVPGPIAVVDRVWGLNDGWNATAAVQRALDDPNVVVQVTIDGQPTGPPFDRPRAEF